MDFRAPLGYSDFRDLRRAGVTYVDKTAFVAEVLDNPAKVLLLPRPRRFGKTLNLSTLRYFLERSDEDRSDLFEGLSVWGSEDARAHFGRYPVVFLTFKDVKLRSWEHSSRSLANLLSRAYGAHRYLLDEGALDGIDAEDFSAVLERRAGAVDLMDALRNLSRYLHAYHGEPAVVLIDEYDTPIHAGFAHGFSDDAVEFFRNLLSGGLKDNPHLFRGVVTGILRVARESIFSGLNNLAVYSLLRPEYATAFGFTEAEVEHLTRLAGASERLAELRSWYDGYVFGGQLIFNPWSVLSFLASSDRVAQAWWVSTSSNDLLRDLLLRGGLGAAGDLETLLSGGGVERPVEENVVFRDLERRPEAVWSLLLFSGYLKADDVCHDTEGTRAVFSVPNLEVGTVYRTVFRHWLEAGLGGEVGIRHLLAALLSGDERALSRLLSDLLVTTLSYHDLGGRQPEQVYHAFIAGLLVQLGADYEVRSNRESGHGRYDVMVLPRRAGQAGVVLELKVPDPDQAVEEALEAGLRQIRERDYAAELRARGAEPIVELAVAFDGKRAYVRGGGG